MTGTVHRLAVGGGHAPPVGEAQVGMCANAHRALLGVAKLHVTLRGMDGYVVRDQHSLCLKKPMEVWSVQIVFPSGPFQLFLVTIEPRRPPLARTTSVGTILPVLSPTCQKLMPFTSPCVNQSEA